MKRLASLLILAGSLTFTAFANTEAGGHHEPPVVYKWLNFGILALGLAVVAVKAGGPFFANRAREIAAALDGAKRVRAESEAQVAEISRRIANLDTELASMKAEARAALEQERIRSSRETENLKTKMQAAAEQEIAAAAKNAEFELRRFSSQLALGLAEQKIRTRMNDRVQGGLVGSFVSSLEQRG
ncbi:MAG: hypothetical protein IT163_10205 [Bryobacterales bacterium]|nr:hypothetical protein [Bryobacterales bacterium]